MNLLKNLAAPKKREVSGPLTGKIIPMGNRTLKIEAVLGEGGFATIYRAVDAITQEIFALKHFMLSGDVEAERDVQTEVAVMRALSGCPHALSLHDAALGTGSAFLLLDYCHGTLAGHLIERGTTGSSTNSTSRLSNAEVTAAFLPIARAVAALHAMDPPMAHRDVKAENILCRTDGSWVLCDFGSATSEQKVYSSPMEIAREEERIRKQTTPAYRAPELWDLYTREFIGTAVDVWSLGCLLYFIAFGKLPFDGDAKLQILNGKYAVPARRPEGVTALIADMLVVDPKRRITAAEVAARAAGMMIEAGGSGGNNRSNAEQSRPPVTATQKAVSRSSNDAFTSNDAWGQAFDTITIAPLSSSAAATAAPMVAAGSGGSGNWADFASQKTIASPIQSSRTNTAREYPQPPTQQLQTLHIDDDNDSNSNNSSAQLEEHCKVLEQLLEERNKEVSTLRNELKRAVAATTEIEATLQGEREQHAATVAKLKKEIDVVLQRTAFQSEAGVKYRSGESYSLQQPLNTSTPAGNLSSTSLASFPLDAAAADGDDAGAMGTSTVPQTASGLGGTPMRRQNSSNSASSLGRPASPEKRLPSGLMTGRQDSFFKDLNPLS
jgi:serine/threonine protein kinase